MRRKCEECRVTKPEEYFPTDVTKIEKVCVKCVTAAQDNPVAPRNCLVCDTKFKSSFKFNRICSTCKRGPDYLYYLE